MFLVIYYHHGIDTIVSVYNVRLLNWLIT